MKTEKPTLPYEEAAEVVTVTGWMCKTCRRWCGDDEDMARYCCAADMACECGKRRGKGWTVCDDCRDRKALECYQRRERVAWDGKTPLTTQDDDRYFFSSEDVAYYLEDLEVPITREAVEGLRLVLCVENETRHFDLADFYSDDLPEDGDPPGEWRIAEDAVNAWAEKNRPLSWTMGKLAVTPESVWEFEEEPKESDQ